jgi:hypothetical protein
MGTDVGGEELLLIVVLGVAFPQTETESEDLEDFAVNALFLTAPVNLCWGLFGEWYPSRNQPSGNLLSFRIQSQDSPITP